MKTSQRTPYSIFTNKEQGCETKVGEGGIKLSGGQRQRLAIARSIIKRPPILILDEATSSIDVRGKRVVQAALDQVSKNRTTIVIAHRLSTIKKADHIIVLKEGHVAEEGTHDELLSSKHSIYHTLVHAQNLELGDQDEDITTLESLDQFASVSSGSEDQRTSSGSDSADNERDPYKPRGLFSTVGLFLYEQRTYSLMYTFVILAAMGCGGMYLSLLVDRRHH